MGKYFIIVFILLLAPYSCSSPSEQKLTANINGLYIEMQLDKVVYNKSDDIVLRAVITNKSDKNFEMGHGVGRNIFFVVLQNDDQIYHTNYIPLGSASAKDVYGLGSGPAEKIVSPATDDISRSDSNNTEIEPRTEVSENPLKPNESFSINWGINTKLEPGKYEFKVRVFGESGRAYTEPLIFIVTN